MKKIQAIYYDEQWNKTILPFYIDKDGNIDKGNIVEKNGFKFVYGFELNRIIASTFRNIPDKKPEFYLKLIKRNNNVGVYYAFKAEMITKTNFWYYDGKNRYFFKTIQNALDFGLNFNVVRYGLTEKLNIPFYDGNNTIEFGILSNYEKKILKITWS